MATKPIYSNTQVISQLDSGYHWTGTSLTYGFPSTAAWFPYAEKAGFSPLTSTERAMATQAVTLWDDLIKPNFSLVADGSTANVKFENTTTNIGYAHAYYPGSWSGAGSVWLNSSYGATSGTNNLMSPVPGSWGYTAWIHETGHALGLDHPGDYNGGSPTYETNAAYMQDSQMYSLMSYFTADKTGADWYASDNRWYYPQTPMLHDVLAIQAMYGADTTTRSGNTTYGFNATYGINSLYDFTQNKHPVLCIYDGAGIDTLDFSGWNTASVINLAPGSFSNCDMMTFNVSIAYSAWIENAVGGGGADVITGNDLANVLRGMAGNDSISAGLGNDRLEGGDGNDTLAGGAGDDILDGGAGTDLAVFSGLRAAYTVVYDTLLAKFTFASSADGTDTTYNVESFKFADGTFAATSLISTVNKLIGGGTGQDSLIGSVGMDTLTGLAGNDSLNGGTGADRLVGGLGDDSYWVDAAGDLVVENASEGTDTVNAAISWTLAVNVEDLNLLGTANLNGTGNSLNNAIAGNDGNNSLDGGAGNDTLKAGAGADTVNGGEGADYIVGGGGKDMLTGGAGADTFVFLSVADSGRGTLADTITDFISGVDRIDLGGIDAKSATATNDAFAFIGTGLFTKQAGQLRFSGGVVQGDVNGDGISDFDIVLSGLTSLAGRDFVL